MKFLAYIFLFLLLVAQNLALPQFLASAASGNLVILQLQTAGPISGTASQEFILLYNSSDIDMNVSNYCVGYSSAANGVSFNELSCATPPDAQTELWLSANGFISFATTEFVSANPGFAPDYAFSSGLAATGGHLRLIDSNNIEIDRVGWGGAIAPEGLAAASVHVTGQVLSRSISAEIIDTDVNFVDFSSQLILSPITSGLYEKEIIIDLCMNIEGVQVEFPEGYLSNENGDCFEDFCPNLDELQIIAPVGFEKLLGSIECTEIPLEDAVLFITELLPNAPGSDTNQEFIELYNPNDREVELVGYRLQLGPGFTKEYAFQEGTIKPRQYIAFSDANTKITLPNSVGQQLRLITPAGNTVSSSIAYSNAEDDVSWALVEDNWIYTNQITPGATNKPYLEPVVDEVLGVTTVLSPCPAGKFRNPATNRCKTIETAISQLTPCDEDEFRNPETNRCKKLSTGSTSLTACAEGQERNPETNRCRKVSTIGVSDISDLPDVTDVKVENTEGKINWFVILVTLLGTFGYMAYEWRVEMQQLIGRMKQRLYNRI